MELKAEPIRRTTFPVAEVTPSTNQLANHLVRNALEQTLRSSVVVCPDAELPVVKSADFHPLIASAALAFKKHHPLVLSPDILWITILQGVAQHIANHANGLRHRLVQHETKVELVVDTNLEGLPATTTEMLGLVSTFVERIGRHLLPDKRFLVGVEFSTTTDVARIAGCVTFMDAMQSYFDYVFMCVCGIPSIILEGTPEDWELLSAKVQALHESDLELSWWTKQLLPLTDHFVRASRGDVDRDHWQNLCKVMERYGTEDLNGWMLKFIPYIRKGKNEPLVHRNPVLEFTDYSDKAKSTFEITGCTSDMLPTGLSRAPVTRMNKTDGSREQFDFAAGFIGVTQNPHDLSLKATVAWAIAECSRMDRLISELRLRHIVEPPARFDGGELASMFDGNLPGDLLRFYTETNGAQIENETKGVNYELFGIAKTSLVWDPSDRDLKRLHHDQQWSVLDYGERSAFARSYGRLRRIASGDDGSTFVFGNDPEEYRAGGDRKSRGVVFRWTGELHPEAFTPVACTFSDWLENLLTEG